MNDNDDSGKFFSRTGPNIGDANENRLLQKVGGANTIRKTFQNNADGSVTMLHTRGPGTQPELVTTSSEKKEASYVWAWPWHGLERSASGEMARVIEDSLGGAVATKGESPETALPQGFNFVASKPSAAEFGSIPKPVGSKPGAQWVNWAAISNGVLFGENVGMNVWLYTVTDKCFVCKMTLAGTASVTVAFYTLDNWVAGMPADMAEHFVKYDKSPTPYMVKRKPAGATRTPVSESVVSLPSYYRATTGVLRVKRGDVAFDGSKIILAYEIESPDPLVWDVFNFNYRQQCFAEDQWVELGVAGNFALSVTVLKQGGGCLMVVDQSTIIAGDEAAHPTGASTWTVPWEVQHDYTYSFVPKTGEHGHTVTYLYTPFGVAEPVRITLSNNRNITTATENSGSNIAGYPVLVSVETDNNESSVELAFNGFSTKATTTFTGVVTRHFFRVGSFPPATPPDQIPVEREYSITVTVDDAPVFNSSSASANNEGVLTYAVVSIGAEGSGPYYIDGLSTGGSWGSTDESASPYSATPMPGASDLTFPASTTPRTSIGVVAWAPIVQNFLGGWQLADNLYRGHFMRRDAFGLFTIGYTRYSAIVTGAIETEFVPLVHLTPYGVLSVPLGDVAPLEFKNSVTSSSPEISKVVFDAQHRNAEGGKVKYAKLDGTYRARRYV